MPLDERRKDSRYPVNVLVHVATDDLGQLAERYATDLSREGLFVHTREPFPVGTRVRLEFRLGGDRDPPIRALAVVRFSQPNRPGSSPPVRPGMGLQFLDLDNRSRRTLENAYRRAGAVAKESRATVPEATDYPPTRTPLPLPLTAKVVEAPRDPVAPLPPTLGPGVDAGPRLSRDALHLPGLDPSFVPSRDGPVIGIDLGTTHSCVALVRDGRAEVLPTPEGHRSIPSTVAFNARSRLVVGHQAQGQLLTLPEQTVYGSKRLLGRPFRSMAVQTLKDRFCYEIVEGSHTEAAVKLGGTLLALEEIAALILQEARETAQDAIGRPIHRAVITCPAYYNEAQRSAVREAGRLAGLHVERILGEPTAAALAFGYGKGLQKRILVYDLGGGTFDASILEIHDTVFEVVSTAGDNFLGGIDFDALLVDHLLAEFKRTTGHDIPPDRVALQRITDAAERAKCALSDREIERILVPFVAMIDGKPRHLDVTITRRDLEELTAPLVERSIGVVMQVMAAKEFTSDQIDDVVLVGGMSRMPMVRRRLEQFFGHDVNCTVHPDEAVALGAALLGHSVERTEGVVLIDVVPISVWIGLPDGGCRRVIERNASLPITRTILISASGDSGNALELPIYQGERECGADNQFVGMLGVTELLPPSKGLVKLAVTVHLSAESVLTVTARELSTGRTAQAVMTTRSMGEESIKVDIPHSPDGAARDPEAVRRNGPLGFLRRLFKNQPRA